MEYSTIFKSFKINGLFGDRDVDIPFDANIKILIGENGLGKTTILNILYYAITNKLYKLRNMNFESLQIQFIDDSQVEISKNDIIGIDEDEDNYDIPSHIIYEIENSLSDSDIEDLKHLFESGQYSIHDLLSHSSLRTLMRGRYRLPSRILINVVKNICGINNANESVKKLRNKIDHFFKDTEILYFPTFRRIEEDLFNLGFDEENLNLSESDNRLIQFGMRDVRARFNQVKKDINILSSKGLSQISSEILSQLVKGIPNVTDVDLDWIESKNIEIILARVGDAISQDDKDKIIKSVSDKRIQDSDDKYLIYFLNKLIQVYEQQRYIDSSIENFVSVCNKYLKLSKKEIIYEASEVEFYLVNKHNNNKILLDDLLSKLSSGEKQIISLFSKIYLSTKKEYIILFDEPELSLSIFWQKLLLPDIISSDKCKFLMAVTHSPFIFENEFQESAIGLNEYTKFYK